MRYEGYGPGGVAVIVETLTDNKNRTASEVRTLFSKNGGNMGEANSVSFQFDQLGELVFEGANADFDTLFEAALEAGAEDVVADDGEITVYVQMDDFHRIREALAETFGDPKNARLMWRPQNLTPVDAAKAETFLKLINALEDNDDVQNVFSNVDIPEDVLNSLDV